MNKNKTEADPQIENEGFQRGGGGRWEKWVKRIKEYKLPIINYRNVMHSIGNIYYIVSYGDRWLTDLTWWYIFNVYKCQITVL